MAKPEQSFFLGGVNASIFVNEGQQGSFRTITLQRRYKDQAGNWKSSDSFTAAQAASAAALLQQAVAHVLQKEGQREEEPQPQY